MVGNGGELGFAGVESELNGAVGTNDVRRPMEQGSDKAQCGGGILCADVDVSPSTMVRRLPKTGWVNRVRSVLMSSRLPQRRPGDAPCSALVLSGPRRRATWFDNPSL